MVRIAICDDMPEITNWMKKAMQEHKFEDRIEIDVFNTGPEIFKNAVKKRYDIIFMDIELMPGDKTAETGMDVSQKIKEAYPETLIIFFSAFPDYKTDLSSCESFRFVDKPLKEEELFRVIDDAIKRVKGWEDKFFTFRWEGISGQIDLKRTILFSSSRPYIEVKTIDEELKFRGKMDDVEKQVSMLSHSFLRPNKSYLVNRSYIKRYSSKEVTMENGERISLGRKYAKKFLERMKK